jgi:hypothetical protein
MYGTQKILVHVHGRNNNNNNNTSNDNSLLRVRILCVQSTTSAEYLVGYYTR